jgi:hypothetical protein
MPLLPAHLLPARPRLLLQGCMEGEFLFAELDSLGAVCRNFEVKIGRFGLDSDGPAIL